jgi:hypothetical protein
MLLRLLMAFALACAGSGVWAQESRAESSLQKLIDAEVFDRIESADGKATITVGKHFNSSELQSRQDIVRVAFDYLKAQDSAIDKITLVDATGRVVGEYSQGRLITKDQ